MYIAFLGLVAVADRIISAWANTKKRTFKNQGRLMTVLIIKVN